MLQTSRDGAGESHAIRMVECINYEKKKSRLIAQRWLACAKQWLPRLRCDAKRHKGSLNCLGRKLSYLFQ